LTIVEPSSAVRPVIRSLYRYHSLVAYSGLENREDQQPRLDLHCDGKSVRLLVRRPLRLRNSLFWISAYLVCFRSDLKFVALSEANYLTVMAPQMATSRFRTARSVPGGDRLIKRENRPAITG